MKLPYLFNPFYRAARLLTPEKIKPTLRGLYNALNKYVTYGHSDIFTALDIETNSRCNLRCGYCPVSRWNRGDHFMPEALYRKIIDDVAAFPFEYKGRVSPHFYGDPLIDDRLPRLLSYTRQKLPKSLIIIHTNGIKLTRERYRELVNIGVNGFLITRHMAHWPKTVRDIMENESDSKKYIRLQTLGNVGLFDRGGVEKVKKPHHFRRCFYVSDEIAIDYLGNVVCTNDFFIRDSFGNINTQSLGEIWWNEKFKKIRKELRHGNIMLQHCRESCGLDDSVHKTVPENATVKDMEPWPIIRPTSPPQKK